MHVCVRLYTCIAHFIYDLRAMCLVTRLVVVVVGSVLTFLSCYTDPVFIYSKDSVIIVWIILPILFLVLNYLQSVFFEDFLQYISLVLCY